MPQSPVGSTLLDASWPSRPAFSCFTKQLLPINTYRPQTLQPGHVCFLIPPYWICEVYQSEQTWYSGRSAGKHAQARTLQYAGNQNTLKVIITECKLSRDALFVPSRLGCGLKQAGWKRWPGSGPRGNSAPYRHGCRKGTNSVALRLKSEREGKKRERNVLEIFFIGMSLDVCTRLETCFCFTRAPPATLRLGVICSTSGPGGTLFRLWSRPLSTGHFIRHTPNLLTCTLNSLSFCFF